MYYSEGIYGQLKPSYSQVDDCGIEHCSFIEHTLQEYPRPLYMCCFSDTYNRPFNTFGCTAYKRGDYFVISISDDDDQYIQYKKSASIDEVEFHIRWWNNCGILQLHVISQRLSEFGWSRF